MKIIVDDKEVDYPENTDLLKYLKKTGKHVPGFCRVDELDPYGSCRLCLIDSGDRLFAGCNYTPRENDKITTLSENIIDMRKTNLELMLSDHIGDCIAPCQNACPANADVQGYLALIAMGKYTESVKLMKEKYVLPAVLGRVCPAFCEKECRRELIDEPLALRQTKRFAADYDLKNGPWMPDIPSPTGKKIAIIGGGPAGLSCAYYLRIKGHDITIYEAMPELGGMLRYGIPSYRLPRKVLDRDIATIIDLGIVVKNGMTFGKNITIEYLRKNYDAVFLAIGAWESKKMKVKGEELDGVVHGIDFLHKVNLNKDVNLGKKVIVVGGGNTAMDVARTSKRLGAEVTLVYRRSREEMPANDNEIEEAEEEGIDLMLLANPIEIIGKNKVEKVKIIKMKLGEPDDSGRRRPVPIENSEFTIDADNVFIAIGQNSDEKTIMDCGIESKWGNTIYDKISFETNLSGIFVGGDQALGASTVIECIASGRKAAKMIDLYLNDKLEKTKDIIINPSKYIQEIENDEDLKNMILELKSYNHWKKVTKEDYANLEKIPRTIVKLRDPQKRKKDFEEVEPSLTKDQVLNEGKRCLSCGCMEVFTCKLRYYSTLYNTNQYTFQGEIKKYEIDESDSNIVLDNNKCVLCGQCVNLTQEITGEGLLDYIYRGFDSRVSPPKNMKLNDLESYFKGDMIDVCPTGALSEKLHFVKPGPWDTKSTQSICVECGLGCEINIETYENFPVRISSKYPSWNMGHVCDKGRFTRSWRNKLDVPALKDGMEISLEETKNIIKEKMTNLVFVVAPDTTIEDAEYLIYLADNLGLKVCGIYDEGLSTAKYEDILKAGKILLKVDLNKFPVLKIFLNKALKNSAELVEEDYDLAILEAPEEPTNKPTLILHQGINEVGLIKLGLNKVSKSLNYFVIGDLNKKLDGYTIVVGNSNYADLLIPGPSHVEKEGTIINSEGRELKLNKAIEGKSIKEILNYFFK